MTRIFHLALHWQILLAMLLGAAIGATLNAVASGRVESVEVRPASVQLRGMPQPVQLPAGRAWLRDSSSEVAVQLSELDAASGRYHTRRLVVGPGSGTVDWPPLPPQVNPEARVPRTRVPTLMELQRVDPAAYALFQMRGRSLARRAGDMAEEVGRLFLRLLQMVSIPLIVTSLITGVTGLGQAERLGRMFGRTLTYYLVTSLLAIIVGLTFVNLIRPGEREVSALSPLAAGAEERSIVSGPAEGRGLGSVLYEQLENMIPPNPVAALAQGNFLSIIAFSIAFAVFTLLVGGRTAEVISELASAGFQVIMRMTMAIILLAPIGVLFLMLSATATQGIGVFGALGLYMLTVALALLFHAALTLPLLVKFVARRSPLAFLQAMSPALLTAFSSASSNGTLPLTMTCAEERAGISNRVTSFVLPLGATVNMDGTALYEAVAVLFIAQLTGHDLTLAQQIVVALTALLASIGAAGIPHAGLVMMVIILQAVGLPTEAQGLIIAVDRVLDMARTSVNVWSDSCGCAVISRFEAEP